MSKEPYYVGLDSPQEVRRDLLLSSKDCIDCLKNYEKLKFIRKKKVEKIFKFEEAMEELLVLNRKLRGALPKTKFRAQPITQQEKEEKKETRKKKVKKIKKKARRKAKTPLEELQRRAQRIEQEMQELEHEF